MITGLIQGLLPAIILTLSLNTPYSPSATLQATNSAELRESRYYVVKEGDTLRSIAFELYGDEESWQILWNDNDWIQNPQRIEPSWKLKIRDQRPIIVEELKDSLLPTITASESIPTPVPQSAPVQEVTPTPSQQPFVSTYIDGPLSEAQITFLGNCESGMNPTTNTGNGFYGAFQFTISTWNAMGTGYARADLAPLDVQVAAVQKLLTRSSIWTQFPGCAVKMQLAGLL